MNHNNFNKKALFKMVLSLLSVVSYQPAGAVGSSVIPPQTESRSGDAQATVESPRSTVLRSNEVLEMLGIGRLGLARTNQGMAKIVEDFMEPVSQANQAYLLERSKIEQTTETELRKKLQAEARRAGVSLDAKVTAEAIIGDLKKLLLTSINSYTMRCINLVTYQEIFVDKCEPEVCKISFKFTNSPYSLSWKNIFNNDQLNRASCQIDFTCSTDSEWSLTFKPDHAQLEIIKEINALVYKWCGDLKMQEYPLNYRGSEH